MGILDWLFSRKKEIKDVTLTQGAINFIEGKEDILTSYDLDPEGAEKYRNYERAMSLKKAGDLVGAAKLLIKSCEPPSIYKGHYQELFKIWRQLNREDLRRGIYSTVVDRVLKMVRLDNEMINEMLNYWGKQQKKKLPTDYFESDRNLKVTDAKALLEAAKELNNEELVQKGYSLLEYFSNK